MPLLDTKKEVPKPCIYRKGSITELYIGRIMIRTNLINRYRYNNLRKKSHILPDDFFLAVRKKLKR